MMSPEDMAVLHRKCFNASPRPWTASEFQAYLTDGAAIVQVAAGALGVVRVSADEAELLTLAVAPEHRRAGAGRRLLDDLCTKARRAGAADMFLEVAANNAPARALYDTEGFREVGRRASYYGGIDALILRRTL